jgi:hypothetical protein
MKIKEHGNLFVREDGQTYPFHSFIERSVQGRLASLGLPPFTHFDALTSWPTRGCDDVVKVLNDAGWIVENDGWVPAVQEHSDHYSRGDVRYSFRSPAQKIVAHDLAHAGCPPLDFAEYPVGERYGLIFVFPDDARKTLWVHTLAPRLFPVLIKQLEEQHGKPRVNICGSTFLSEIEEC